MERIEYEVELERTDRPAEHTSMTLPPALTKGQRLNVPVEGGYVHAEVIEVTKLTRIQVASA
jgi:sRNA-binding protein